MGVVGWLVVITLLVFAYVVYEALVWPIIDLRMPPNWQRPWTIRRLLNRLEGRDLK